MKRILLSALGAVALLLTSCQKDDLATSSGAAGDMLNISVALADVSGSATRAIADYGSGSSANRCILEIYDVDGDLYKRMIEPVVENGGMYGADFSVRLVTTGKDYTFVAWADHIEGSDLEQDYYYNTANGLKSITFNDSMSVTTDFDIDYKDAFFASIVETFGEAKENFAMTLTRPFGQVNVFTKITDIDLAKYQPKSVKVEYAASKFYTGFNAESGVLSGENSAYSYERETIETVVDANGYIHLTTDYIFAPGDGEEVIDFDMTFYSDDACTDLITKNTMLDNIPVKRNYRTNVYGELLTEDCYIAVSLDPVLNDFEHNVSIGDYFYADGTIYPTYYSSKTLKGKVYSVTDAGCYVVSSEAEFDQDWDVAHAANAANTGLFKDQTLVNGLEINWRMPDNDDMRAVLSGACGVQWTEANNWPNHEVMPSYDANKNAYEAAKALFNANLAYTLVPTVNGSQYQWFWTYEGHDSYAWAINMVKGTTTYDSTSGAGVGTRAVCFVPYWVQDSVIK